MRSCLKKLNQGFWIYGLICILGPSGPDVVSRPQRPQGQDIFQHFMTLLNLSTYDPDENEVLFVKIGAMVLV